MHTIFYIDTEYHVNHLYNEEWYDQTYCINAVIIELLDLYILVLKCTTEILL